MSVRNAVLSVVVLLGLVVTDAAQAAPDLYGTVSPSVVYLEHEIYMDPAVCHYPDLWQRFTQVTKHPFLSTYFPMASGSGFFIDDKGHIVTNHHVAVVDKVAEWRHAAEESLAMWADKYLVSDFSSAERDALKDDVIRLFEGGKYRFAAMVGNQFVGEVNVLSVADKDGPDLALVQAGTSSTPSLQLASESDIGSILIGQDVFSLGYPLGFELDAMFKERVVTLNKGIVSAYRESDSLDIQHSAAISHGNSGGPLVDSRGEVIGINSVGLQEVQGNSLFYAIGAAKVRDFLAKAGYGQMLVWNERLAHMGEQESGLRANAQGELETSSTLVVDVSTASSIKVDGVEKGHGPLTLTLANPLSALEVTDDVGTFSAKLRLTTALRGTSTMKLSPRGALVTVSFASDPPGAAVFADNRSLGFTPLQVALPPGDYAIKYQLSGYLFEESKLQVQLGNPTQFALAGKKAGPIFGLAATEAPQSASNLYGLASPSVVYLEHEIYMDPTACRRADLWQRFTQITKHPFLSTYFPMASGSGFFIDDRGHILTNHHVAVIEDLAAWRRAAKESVAKWVDQSFTKEFSSTERLAMKDDLVSLFESGKYRFAAMVGNRFIGEVSVLSVSEKDGPDLALIQVGTASNPNLLLAPGSDISTGLIGQDVFSLGYPLGFELDAMFKERVVTLNKGIISAYRGSDALDIQHSAAISHGNSGGPLVDTRGEVIGINSAGLQESNGNSLFYAIGAAKVRDFLSKAGFGQLLLWNERLARMGEEASGLKTNAQGELETAGTLRVDVPTASSIKVDGVEKGHGSLTLVLTTPLSTLEVTDDVGTFTANLRVRATQQGASTLRLSPRGGVVSVSFTSNPPGAAVIADGRPLGVTPLHLSLPAGDYEIKCQLSSYEFKDSLLKVQPEGPAELIFNGLRTYPVALKIRDDLSNATLNFRSDSHEYHFSHPASLSLPSGDYKLTVAGLEALDGVSIPVHVAEGPLEIDLEAAKKKANLLIRGLDPLARVWVDRVEQPMQCSNPLLLSVGTHSLAIWKDGRVPFNMTDVTVRSDNSSFVMWNNAAGNDVWSSGLGWTGLGLGVAGLALTVVGFYFDNDGVAISSSTSYSGYTSIKSLAGISVVSGFGLIGAATVSEVIAFIKRREFETQKQAFRTSVANQ